MAEGRAKSNGQLDDRLRLIDAFRFPRGRYRAERAAQLSGVPERTVYHWALHGVMVPDFPHASPKRWSYRDLVFLRLLARLRALGMSPKAASVRVASTRDLMASGDVRVDEIHVARTGVYLPNESYDRLSGQETIAVMLSLTETFDLLAPLESSGAEHHMRGPDLVYPSDYTYISPWVMGGDPCVNDTRIPTATVLTLVELRGLPIDGVLALYPSLTEASAEDALALERRLSGSGVGA